MPANKKRLLPDARTLYAQGLSPAEIAEVLSTDGTSVSERTILRWMAADKAAGRDWAHLRQAYLGRDPSTTMVTLDRAIAAMADRIAACMEADEPFTAEADAIQKLDKVREGWAARHGNLPTTLSVLHDVAAHAHKAPDVSPADLGVLRRVFAGFIDELRRQHS